ncbi:MAB_1171c family putative transporter [Streptomyces sp. NPDC004579]|uniref:MAB_1171c family putative transporter n=1 Tax=Streptomyces sp. NPDC004579 TaxID=3154667 RepID=UPI0033A6C4DC
MVSDGIVQYVSCGVLWLGLAVKGPDLIRHWRDPILRVICAVMALAGLCFAFGSPPTVGAINRISGIPNLAAPLTYAVITAYSATSLVLIVYWKGGPDVSRIARRLMTCYGGVLVGIALLFALGDAPVERRTDFDTYYATTPFTAEMIVLYLLAHLTAVTTTALWSLRWARQVRGWLRTGLITLGVGTALGAGYSVSKLTAVVAWWCGVDWSAISTNVSPGLAGLGALLTVVGILIPWAGPGVMAWLVSWRTYRRLAPLERALETVLTDRNLRLPRPWPSSAAALLIWRQTSINNALGYVDVLLDADLFARVHDTTFAATGDSEQAQAEAWAAAIATFVREVHATGLPTTPGGLRPVAPAPDAAALVRIARVLALADAAPPARPHQGSPSRDTV